MHPPVKSTSALLEGLYQSWKRHPQSAKPLALSVLTELDSQKFRLTPEQMTQLTTLCANLQVKLSESWGHRLMDNLVKVVPMCKPHELCNSLNSLSRLGWASAQVYAAVTPRARVLAENRQLNPRDVAALLYAYAGDQVYENLLFRQLSLSIQDYQDEVPSSVVAILLNSFSALSFCDPSLFRGLAHWVESSLVDQLVPPSVMSAGELCYLLNAFARCHHIGHISLLNAVLGSLVHQLSALEVSHLTQVFHACARLGLEARAFWTLGIPAYTRMLSLAKTTELANTIQALAKMGVQPPVSWFHEWNTRENTDAQACVQVLDALRRKPLSAADQEPSIQKIQKFFSQHVQDFQIHGLTQILFTFLRLKVQLSVSDWEQAMTRLQRLSNSLTPTHVRHLQVMIRLLQKEDPHAYYSILSQAQRKLCEDLLTRETGPRV